MLGKLYIAPNSNPDKVQNVIGLVSEAIDERIASDAFSRNNLNKLSVALSKTIGDTGNMTKVANETVNSEAEVNAKATEDERESSEPEPMRDADMKTEVLEDDEVTDVKDSLLDELLDDEDP